MSIESPFNKDIIFNYSEDFSLGRILDHGSVNEIFDKITEEIYRCDNERSMIVEYSILTYNHANGSLKITINIAFYSDDKRSPNVVINNIKSIFLQHMTMGK